MSKDLTPQSNDIIFYSSPHGDVRVEVFFQEETFWLCQKKMAELFGVESNTVTYHLEEIYQSGELELKEWDDYDFFTKEDCKIEAKSSAYIHSWKQKEFSKILFSIEPTRRFNEEWYYVLEKKRQADICIFCLLHHKDQNTIIPMNLEQWTFYLVRTSDLNDKFPLQNSISLKGILNMEHEQCDYLSLKKVFDMFSRSIKH